MAYIVDHVVICDAYREPNAHYRLQPGGRSRRVEGRRPSMRFLASAKDVRGGIAGVVGREASLFEDLSASGAELNEFVNALRDEIRQWREAGYPGTAMVTRRLVEWWFERDEERTAVGQRFFFCQQEAAESLIYLYEVQNRRRMPETGNLLRYALKLATGTGKTVIMAMLVTWSTLHRRKVSGSPLSANFLVLVPNLTVRDRVSGIPRGDGLNPTGEHNLYEAFDMVPPEYREEFRPNVVVRNWQGIPLETRRDDWIGEGDIPLEEGRFIPQAVLRAMRRRARQDPDAPIRRVLHGWRDVVVINDEAHHVYGEKRTKQGEDPAYIKWSKILERVSRAARVPLVVDVSATPWYGSGSTKPEGTLFEWLVSDFSVYDAFESGLVKVVRLPDPDERGNVYIDLWDQVKGAKTKVEYLRTCKGAIASIYSSWRKDYEEWESTFETMRGPSPVLLCVVDSAQRAAWLFEHLTREYELLRNPHSDERARWVTIQIDSRVFDADKGNAAVLRDMVNTVGSAGKPGEHVRCIVSVNMLSEGWDVKSVTHILGLRAFGSPLLTEQIIGRGLRRTSYDVLNQPLDERPEGYEETADAFGIPFVGFPVQKRKRPKTGSWGNKPIWIEPAPKKEKYRVRVPNVRSWAVGVVDTLAAERCESRKPPACIAYGRGLRSFSVHSGRIPMKTTTQTRLRRTAAEAVGSIPGIKAVVLYGSRARGTARATSDWDVAILSHASPDDERAARRVFDDLERVHPIVMKPESIEAHCNEGLRIESAIARQGRLLAGEWTPPPCRTGDLDVEPEDLGKQLDTATHDVLGALVALCATAPRGLLYVPKIVEESQQAAEAVAKAVIAGFGLSPATVHELDKLAVQLENAYRGRTREAEDRMSFAAAIRALDGNTKAAHGARYEAVPVEMPDRTIARVRCTLRLQTRWIRWYAERYPEMRGAAVAAAGEIAHVAGWIENLDGFDRIDAELRAQVRAWGEEGRSIAAEFDRGDERSR